MRPDAAVATVRLLRRLGLTVHFPERQTCCGQPFYNSGFMEGARDLARHTIEAFADGRTVVVPSGSCAAMVRIEFPHLFHDDAVWGPRAKELADRLKRWKQPKPNYRRGILAKYAAQVSSASEGAVTDAQF